MPFSDIKIDPQSAVPVYRQIAESVLAAARVAGLEPGHRLPATRDLARQLGVNRQTVVAAYEHLATEGSVVSHTGKGTFLAAVEPGAPAPTASAAEGGAESWMPGFARAVEGPDVGGLLSFYQAANVEAGISFAGSYPARDLMPVDDFRRAVDATLADHGSEVLRYGPTAGFPPLRELLASTMTDEGSVVSADDLLVTNGAQQAIELVFHTFLDPGDAVVIAEPTYTGALSVLGSLGARVIGVPVDEEGMRPDLLAIALERHRPRLMYVQPTFQNPTTSVMSLERRNEILAIAARHRCIVVEDDWANGLRFEGDPLPSLHALDGGRRVVYLSTFSKKLLPGLRVGWIAAPSAVMERLIALKQIRDCGTSPLLQASLHRFVVDGGLDAHLRRVLPANRERRDCMLRALERHFPARARWTRPEGGLFLWVKLPSEIAGQELVHAASREGVRYSSGELFHRKRRERHTLRLTYSAATPKQIEQGIEILGKLIRDRWSGREDAIRRTPAEAMPIL